MSMRNSGGVPVLILKEGTNRTQGRDALKANIMAARILSETIKSSLGPKGMDKMLVGGFGDVTITNDGATILKEVDVQHPAAKMLVEVAKAQDDEVGDGTTTAAVLAGELLKHAEDLLTQDIHPTVIVDGYKKSLEKSLEVLDSMAKTIAPTDKELLRKAAMTALESKAVTAGAIEKFAKVAVDAILAVADKVDGVYTVDLDNIKVEKKEGESLEETELIQGVLIDKEVVSPAMPKALEDAKIALIDAPIEIEKTEITAKINITDPSQMKAFLDQETDMLKGMVDKIVAKGANVVVAQKGIDDVAQHFLAKKGIMAIRRVKKSDMDKLARATGARVVTSLDDLSVKDLGKAGHVEERKVGDSKMVFVEKCTNPKAVSVLVRGGTEMMVNEAERSLHDALCVVRNIVQEGKIVYGGGAPEAEVAYQLREWAKSLPGREQLAAERFADGIESIPLILAENAGLDPVDIITELITKHKQGQKFAGVDIDKGGVGDMSKTNVIEPVSVKKQAIKSATEAATMILRIDDIIAASAPKGGGGPPGGPGGPGGGDFGGAED